MSTRDTELAEAVAAAVEGELLTTSREELETLLGERLQQLLLRASPDGNMPPWAQATFGPASLARRFIDFHRDALSVQLCAPDGSGLKPELARRLEPKGTGTGGLGALAAAILTMLHATAPEAGGSAVAVYVALWMLHTDLQQWCINCANTKDEHA